MGKKLDRETVRAFEEVVVPERLRGKERWPIEVRALDEVATLRLVRGRTRIRFDWVVPDRLREALGRPRFQGIVPKPARHVEPHEDRGRNPALAKEWLREWLRKKVLEGETARERTDPGVLNSIPLCMLIERFRQSERVLAASASQRDQWSLWLDFFRSVLGDEFRMHQVSPDVMLRLKRRYQEEWVRTLPDGSTRTMKTGAGVNTAAKVLRFFQSLCIWGLSEPAGDGHYLLDSNPLARFAKKDRRQLKERGTARRRVGAASDEFAKALLEELRLTGNTGQPYLVYATEAALGRRPGEVRVLRRHHLLTTEEDIADGLRWQACRNALPNDAIPDDEIDEAAKEYFARGWAVHFDAGKQLATDPEAAQHDRVVPLGRRLTQVYRKYLEEHWEPLGLGPGDWLCPAFSDSTFPTRKDTAGNWVDRAKRRVAKRENAPRPPEGRSHPLRHRFRVTHRKELKKVVAFIGGWTLKDASAMNDFYMNVEWQDIVEFIDRVDETTGSVL